MREIRTEETSELRFNFGKKNETSSQRDESRSLADRPDLATSAANSLTGLPIIQDDSTRPLHEHALPLAGNEDNELLNNSLPVVSNLISTSILNPMDVMEEWGNGEGIGTGDVGNVGNGHGPNCQCAGCTAGRSGGSATDGFTGFSVNLDQVVFLDFDSGTDGSVDYTQGMRNEVQAQMELIYEAFGVTFVQVEPEGGDYSTLVFNRGNQGGLAEDIDFRNQNKNDNAVLNVTGLSNNQSDIISASAVIGAHELGHIFGLRHHDAWGPIGAGVPEGLSFRYTPSYPGPEDADETRDHIMNTPALAGQFFDTFSRSWLGEREAIKLTYAANGQAVFETTAQNDTFEDAQMLELEELIVPNTIINGQNADAGDFSIKATSVIGTFGFVDPGDFYAFEGETGMAYSFEVISSATDRYSNVDPIDGIISIFDSQFNPVDYYGVPASNDDDVEFSRDSHLLDLILPESGIYYAHVETFGSGDTGTYELFINSFVASPFNLPDFDDHSDNLLSTDATALVFNPVGSKVVARDGGIVGFVDSPVERDVFKFTIESNAKVIVDARATSDFFDAFAEIYDVDGNRVAFNDNNNNPALPNENDSQIVLQNLRDGQYFVVISGTEGSTGSYRVTVRHNGDVGGVDDHGDSFGDASQFPLSPAPDTTHISAIAERGNDRDMFRFTANSTGNMVIRTRALSGDINTVLRGYDENQNLLDSNNNFNGSLDSRIVLNVIEGEDYFVRVSTVRDTSGAYRLSLRPTGNSSGGSGGAGFSTSELVDKNVSLEFFDDFSGRAAASPTDNTIARVDQYGDLDNGMIA